jgi:hypothetical protein
MKEKPESLRAKYSSSFAEIADAQDAFNAFLEHAKLEPKEALEEIFLEYYVPERGRNDEFKRQVDETVGKVRAVLCRDQHSQQLVAGLIAGTLTGLVQATGLPMFIVTGVLMYVLSVGIEEFCAINR